MPEAYINQKNVNTVQFPDKCFVCGKDKCDDHIKIALFIPLHSDSKCFIQYAYQIMKLNNCGSPLIDTVQTLKKLIKLIETETQASPQTNVVIKPVKSPAMKIREVLLREGFTQNDFTIEAQSPNSKFTESKNSPKVCPKCNCLSFSEIEKGVYQCEYDECAYVGKPS